MMDPEFSMGLLMSELKRKVKLGCYFRVGVGSPENPFPAIPKTREKQKWNFSLKKTL
jgi:hypothetical protein